MATKCFPGWRLGGTSPRFGLLPVPSRGGCPTTRRPQPRPGAPIWPAPSARFFAEPQPAINGGSAWSCRSAAAAVRDPTPGRRQPPEAVRRNGAVTAAAGGGTPAAASAAPHAETPTRSGATVASSAGRAQMAERARRSQGSAPPTSPCATRTRPHATHPRRACAHPIGCTPNRHLSPRSRHARPRFTATRRAPGHHDTTRARVEPRESRGRIRLPPEWCGGAARRPGRSPRPRDEIAATAGRMTTNSSRAGGDPSPPTVERDPCQNGEQPCAAESPQPRGGPPAPALAERRGQDGREGPRDRGRKRAAHDLPRPRSVRRPTPARARTGPPSPRHNERGPQRSGARTGKAASTRPRTSPRAKRAGTPGR